MEVLQFAITMEKDGEAYYRSQAAKNDGNALKVIFEMLADDEAKHARILQEMLDDFPYDLESANNLQNHMNLFLTAKDYCETVAGQASQVELYHTALDKEKQSIDLYASLQDKATDDVSHQLFEFLVKEENGHYRLLEELFHHVNRPNEWVESAEFGVREDY
jgi:rubrerythrin